MVTWLPEFPMNIPMKITQDSAFLNVPRYACNKVQRLLYWLIDLSEGDT